MPRRRSDTMRAVDAVMPLVDEFNLLDEGDKLTFLDLVDPLPDSHDHKPKKKASKRSSKPSSSKSPRATGIEQQLSSRRQQQTVNKGACTFILEDGAVCNTGDNNPIHDESFGYAAYHPFQPVASSAPTRSPANGGAESITVNSGTQTEDAGTVAHGASGGPS